MYWRWLAVPLVIIALVFLYFTWEVDHEKYAVYIIPPVVLLAVLIVFSPQIDWLMAKREPPELDPQIRKLLHQVSPFYTQLNPELKKRMRDRIGLLKMTFDFKPQAMEQVPEDIKAIVAYYAALLTFSFDKFLFSPFETVIIYKGPFPTPQFPQHWHICETFEEDGVLLFSADHLLKGFFQPAQYYPIGLHEMAHAFVLKNKHLSFPDPGDSVWEDIRQVSGVDRERLSKYIGLPEISPLLVSITYFFTLPARYKAVRPDLYASFSNIFQQDPAHV
ncbi:MAG: zinc-dependent peptidase [Saprospirales bacterium]|nr:zinc-dependent peptidase [Saprospirales bacterium]